MIQTPWVFVPQQKILSPPVFVAVWPLLRLFHGRLGQGERPLSFGDWEPLPVVYRTIRSMEPSVWCSFLADRKHMQPSGLAMVVRAERKGDEKGH